MTKVGGGDEDCDRIFPLLHGPAEHAQVLFDRGRRKHNEFRDIAKHRERKYAAVRHIAHAEERCAAEQHRDRAPLDANIVNQLIVGAL